jgi:hypothetical protein
MGRIGETLRKARELREIDLREISDATKINVRYLEAIEENRFESLPGGVFNRGFIRAYANYIGLDAQAIVDNYVHDAEGGPGLQAEAVPLSPGLHRPAEIPPRRSDAQPAGQGAGPAPHGGLMATGVASAPPPAETTAMSRTLWLVAASGVLFFLLAFWAYLVDPTGEPAKAERAGSVEPIPTAAAAVGGSIPDDPPPARGPAREAVAPPAVAPRESGGMAVTITARAATTLRVVCDGGEAIDRSLQRGEAAALRCPGPIRLSAPDASLLGLAIDGSDCGPLGEAGTRLFGYVIRADDVGSLCPKDAAEELDAAR